MVQKWTGTYRGQQAGSQASAIGYLAGDAQFGGTAAKECFTWIDDWAAAIRSAGYVPGIYVGETTGKPLESSQLGELKLREFWKAHDTGVSLSPTGYQMKQTISQQQATLSGQTIWVDSDVTQNDNNSRTPIPRVLRTLARLTL